MKKIIIASTLSTVAFLTLSGCSDSSTDAVNEVIDNATVTVSGTITDASASPTTALPGVNIEGIYTGSLPGSSSSTDASGNYSVTLLKSTDFYLRASLSNYATINSAIKNLAADDTGNDISLPTTADANSLIGSVFNSPSKTLAGSAWLVVDVFDANGDAAPGISITLDTTPVGDEYPDCTGGPSSIGATASCPSGSEAPSYIAEYSSPSKVKVTVNGVSQDGFLATGEVLYMEFDQ